jgi:uncharacterized Zn finger protein (UPF0148 family)
MGEKSRPHPAPSPWPAVPGAPTLTPVGCCSDCGEPAHVIMDGSVKLCPRCYAVLWTRDSENAARRRAEEAIRRKAAQEEATRRRLEGHNAAKASKKGDRPVTDKKWADLMTEAQNLRFQILHNMVLPTECEAMRERLQAVLEKLAKEGPL